MMLHRVCLYAALLLIAACGPSAQRTPASGPSAAASSGPQLASDNARLQALIDGARQEGALDLVWSEATLNGAAGVDRLIRAVNDYYGLNLTARFTPGPSQPQVASTLVAEFTAGRPATTDVYIGGSESYIAMLLSPTVALEKVDWP